MLFIPISFVLCLNLIGLDAIPHSGGLVSTGHSAQYRQDDSYGNYEFGYNEDHSEGGTFRKEKGGPHGVVGSYGLRGADGRIRIVHYIADEHGFRATIESNEPGLDLSQNPASVGFTNGHQMPTAVAPIEPVMEPVVEQVVEPVALHKAPHVPMEHHSVSPHVPMEHHSVSPHVPMEHHSVSPHVPMEHHSVSPLAYSHSLPTPMIAPVPLSYHNSHYQADNHQGLAYEAVLAPLMNDFNIHGKSHALVDPTPNYSHLQYVPEDGLHITTYDGDFGRRFTPLKSHY